MLARQRTTAPVSMRALIARINRRLRDDGEVLKAARSERVASSVGVFFIVRAQCDHHSACRPREPWPASWVFSALGSTSTTPVTQETEMKIINAFGATFAVSVVVVIWWLSLVHLGDTPQIATMWVGGTMAANLIVAYFAQQRRNRSFFRWLTVSLMFSPIIGFVLAACSKTLPEA